MLNPQHDATIEQPVRAVDPAYIIGTLMLESFGLSDPGIVRRNNEDYFLMAPAIDLYVVAD